MTYLFPASFIRVEARLSGGGKCLWSGKIDDSPSVSDPAIDSLRLMWLLFKESGDLLKSKGVVSPLLLVGPSVPEPAELPESLLSARLLACSNFGNFAGVLLQKKDINVYFDNLIAYEVPQCTLLQGNREGGGKMFRTI